MTKNKEILIAITERNLTVFLRFLMQKMDSSILFSHNAINCSYSGFKTCYLNSIVGGNILGELSDSEALKILSFFAKRGASCMWWISADSNIDYLLQKMQYFGFGDAIKLKAMSIRMDEYESNIKKIDDFEVVCVDDQNCFRDYAQIYTSFANMSASKEMSDFYTIVADNYLFLSEKVKYFVGYYKQKPVCTGSLCIDGGVAGIYDVLTLDGARNKGFATTLVSNMLFVIKQFDVKVCVLQSSTQALKIYSAFGFEEFSDFYVVNNDGIFELLANLYQLKHSS